MIIHYQVYGTQDDRPPELQVDVTTVYIRSNIERVENDEFIGWVYDEIQYSKDEYMSLLADKESVNSLNLSSQQLQDALVEMTLYSAELETKNILNEKAIVELTMMISMLGGE